MLSRNPEAVLVAAENAATIRAIPDEALSDPEARAALIALAEGGHEVYAYQPACSAEWVLWIRPRFPWQEGRLTPAEWITRYYQGGTEGAHA